MSICMHEPLLMYHLYDHLREQSTDFLRIYLHFLHSIDLIDMHAVDELHDEDSVCWL